MGGQSCVLKKKFCNPPLFALMSIPESVIDGIESGLFDRKILEDAGLEKYLYRCAEIDQEAAAKYEEANAWFYHNVYRVENRDATFKAPWQIEGDPELATNALDKMYPYGEGPGFKDGRPIKKDVEPIKESKAEGADHDRE